MSDRMKTIAKCNQLFCLFQSLRALPLWLNSLVANEALLKRFYCEGAFIRQCTTSLQGLHADLMTHVEQLLKFPFQFDLAAESKKPPPPLASPKRVAGAPGLTPVKSKSATRKVTPPTSTKLVSNPCPRHLLN